MENVVQSIKVVIDNNPKEYEINNFLKKAINVFLIPILNRIPRRLFVGTSKKTEIIQKNVTTHKALEVIYSFSNELNFENGLLDGFFTYFWLNTNHAKALRNRLKLVKKELGKAIHSFNKKEIKILNLACGSNRAIIEVIGMHKDNFDFEVFCVDKNDSAIEDAKKLCSIFDIEHLFKWRQDTVSGALGNHINSNGIKFDIVEMVGFLDYVKDEKAVILFDQIYSVLSENGVFITGNIKDNTERRFVTDVAGWPNLIYRDENDLIRLLMKSKFMGTSTRIIYEPHNVHGVVVCKK